MYYVLNLMFLSTCLWIAERVCVYMNVNVPAYQMLARMLTDGHDWPRVAQTRSSKRSGRVELLRFYVHKQEDEKRARERGREHKREIGRHCRRLPTSPFLPPA